MAPCVPSSCVMPCPVFCPVLCCAVLCCVVLSLRFSVLSFLYLHHRPLPQTCHECSQPQQPSQPPRLRAGGHERAGAHGVCAGVAAVGVQELVNLPITRRRVAGRAYGARGGGALYRHRFGRRSKSIHKRI
eukprot:gene9652-biopygen10754